MKIIRKLLNLPKRIIRRVYREAHARKYPLADVMAAQKELYEQLGLDRDLGLKKLNEICLSEFGKAYDENDGMFSEHLVLLSAVSVKHTDFKNILEIGTFDGRSAVILSKIFEGAFITTIDLPSDSQEFINTYQRDQARNFVRNRDALIFKEPNITFKEMNSVRLLDEEFEYDLIWVDGAHGYPTAALDIANGYRLAKSGGWVLMDDVFTNADSSDRWYKSIASHQTLQELKAAALIPDFHLIPKRMGAIHNLPWTQKYVGIFRKNGKTSPT